MYELKKLLETRQTILVEKTQEILTHVKDSLEYISRYLISESNQVDGLFLWFEISFDDTNDMATVYAITPVEEGDTYIDNENNTVILTKEMAQMISNMVIKVPIPIKILSSNDEQIINTYMNDLKNKYLKNTDDNVKQNINSVYGNSNKIDDFDINELTDEQRNNLMFFSEMKLQ